MKEILDRQSDKEERSNEVSEESKEEVEGGTENKSNDENASSEENSDEDEKGGGPINAILDLLQLAAPILEDLSDVRKRDFEISNIAPPHHLVLNPFSLNPKPKLPMCSK